jgi:hypothetical protein
MFLGSLDRMEHDQVCIIDGDVGEMWIRLDNVRKAATEYEFPVPRVKRKGMQR